MGLGILTLSEILRVPSPTATLFETTAPAVRPPGRCFFPSKCRVCEHALQGAGAVEKLEVLAGRAGHGKDELEAPRPAELALALHRNRRHLLGGAGNGGVGEGGPLNARVWLECYIHQEVARVTHAAERVQWFLSDQGAVETKFTVDDDELYIAVVS